MLICHVIGRLQNHPAASDQVLWLTMTMMIIIWLHNQCTIYAWKNIHEKNITVWYTVQHHDDNDVDSRMQGAAPHLARSVLDESVDMMLSPVLTCWHFEHVRYTQQRLLCVAVGDNLRTDSTLSHIVSYCHSVSVGDNLRKDGILSYMGWDHKNTPICVSFCKFTSSEWNRILSEFFSAENSRSGLAITPFMLTARGNITTTIFWINTA